MARQHNYPPVGEIPAVDMEALGLDEGTVAFLHDGTWPSCRSEPSFSVLKRLIHAGLDDASIAALLMDPANKAGEKARERGLRWLAGELAGRAAVGKDLRRYADAGMTAEQVALVLWPYSTPPPSSKAWLHLHDPYGPRHDRETRQQLTHTNGATGSSNVTSEDIANSWPPLQAPPEPCLMSPYCQA